MNASIPLVRATVLQMVTRVLEPMGVPVQHFLEQVKLSPKALAEPEALVPFLAVGRFLEEVARSEGIEDLGLRVGATLQPLLAGHFGRVMRQSRSLEKALRAAHLIQPSFNSGARGWLTRSGNQAEIHHRFLHGSERDWRHFAAVALMQYLNLVRSVGGPSWRPTAVHLPVRELPGWRNVPMLANTPITFGQATMRIVFSASLLERRLPWAPAVVTPAELAAWSRKKPADDVGGALRQVVTTMLPDGYPSIHVIASAVRMNPRTLQRRLYEEGLTFAGVVARARFDEARRLLGDPSRKVIDVALDLGYSDPAHFTRAFTRWAGHPPREFRRFAAAARLESLGQ